MTDKQDMTAEELTAEIDRLGAQVARAGAELHTLAGRCKRRKQTAASLKSWGNITLTLGLELRSQAKTVNTVEKRLQEAQP
jgi:predicted RNase H-like nuclease (RuvC/YqgF family)